MKQRLANRFAFAGRLYFWVPPVVVLILIVIDDLSFDFEATTGTAIAFWAFSMTSIQYFHGGLIYDHWHGFEDEEMDRRLNGLRERLHPGIWLAFAAMHAIAVGAGIYIWRFIINVFS